MPLTMYDASVPVLIRGLTNLDAVLTKGEEFASAQGLDPAELVGARLFPDMHPLSGQIQSASDTAKFCPARLTGTQGPSFADTETTFAELHTRIANTLDYLKTFEPAQFEGSETREVILKTRRGERHFEGQAYLLSFALPNFFFHVTTAYDILRQRGVPIGKMDYIGPLS